MTQFTEIAPDSETENAQIPPQSLFRRTGKLPDISGAEMGLFSKITAPGSAKTTSSKSSKDQNSAKAEAERSHEAPKPTTSELPSSNGSVSEVSVSSKSSVVDNKTSRIGSLPKIKGTTQSKTNNHHSRQLSDSYSSAVGELG